MRCLTEYWLAAGDGCTYPERNGEREARRPVRKKGLEPSRLAALEPKSSASANSATPASGSIVPGARGHSSRSPVASVPGRSASTGYGPVYPSRAAAICRMRFRERNQPITSSGMTTTSDPTVYVPIG